MPSSWLDGFAKDDEDPMDLRFHKRQQSEPAVRFMAPAGRSDMLNGPSRPPCCKDDGLYSNSVYH